MKKTVAILIAAIFTSCTCKKQVVTKDAVAISNLKLTSNCPPDGTCTFEVLKNKSLVLKSDEFGSIYTQQIEDEKHSIVIFQYNKNVPKDLQDGNYREEIQFEIPNTDIELDLNNQELQNTKMFFGRYCYCKGQTGIFKVIDGNLRLLQKNNKLSFNLNFKNNKVPQLIDSISANNK